MGLQASQSKCHRNGTPAIARRVMSSSTFTSGHTLTSTLHSQPNPNPLIQNSSTNHPSHQHKSPITPAPPHTLTVLSAELVAMRYSCGWNSSPVMALVCMLNSWMTLPAVRSKICRAEWHKETTVACSRMCEPAASAELCVHHAVCSSKKHVVLHEGAHARGPK